MQPSTGHVWMTCFLFAQLRFLFGLSGLAAALEPLFFLGAGVVSVDGCDVTSAGYARPLLLLPFVYRLGEDGGVRLGWTLVTCAWC